MFLWKIFITICVIEISYGGNEMTKYETLVQILDELRKEAPKEYRSYYPEDIDIEGLNKARSKSFIHLFLKGMYGIENFIDRENFITDASYDGGIDAYYIDEDSKEIIFIQSKFRTNRNNFENKEIDYEELLSMDVDRVTDGEKTDEDGNSYNGKILKMQEAIQGIDDIGRYKYRVIILANLKEKKSKYIKKLTGGFPGDVFDFQKCYKELVFPIVSGCFFNAEEIRINLSLANKEGNEGRIGYTVNTELSDCKIMVTFVPLIEIAKILYKYKNSVLKYNPRCFLGLKNNQVNPQIADTVKNKSTNEFALFNNGITILSDDTQINSQVAKKDKAQLIIMNPQIINGGQTAFTLSSLYEECIQNNNYTIFNDKEVLVKIVTFIEDGKNNGNVEETKQKKLKLIENLSHATNEQSVVSEMDRRSNEAILVNYQQNIYRDFGLFLNRKQGEFYEGINRKYILKKQIIDLSNFMRIAISISGDAKKARQSSDTVLFRENNFKYYLKTESDYKKYVYGYYCYQYLLDTEKKEKNYGMDKYGNALRYGKYAVIGIVSRGFDKILDIKEYKSVVEEKTNSILEKWLSFENEITKKQSNKDYFYKYQEGEDIKFVYNFDGYYKGKTINKDLEDFNFDI